jgi:uncharacterized protein (TIGR04141 family)
MRLSWFLVKSEIEATDVEAIIEKSDDSQLSSFRVPALHKDRDSLFVKPSHPSPPRWLDFVKPHLEAEELPTILGSSSSGVLLVESSGRVLAVSFGYGRHLVRTEAVVQDFGLKVVVNSIDPQLIKSVDARTFDELTIHTRQGASRDSSLGVFTLDNSRDLLRSVTGRSAPGGLGALSGAAALAMNTALPLPQLPDLATELIAAYGSKAYEKDFKFIDDMRGEQDPTVIARLDEHLVEALKSRDMTDMHLAIPEAVDWQQIAGVRFSFKRHDQEETPDPQISVYRNLRDDEQISLKRLKVDKVEAISSLDEGEVLDRWRIYDCMVFETDLDGHLYVLSGGSWYRIDKDFREKVKTYVEGIEELDLDLPEADKSKNEDAYNAAAADALGALCLDRKNVGVGGPDKVEICDILTADGRFIHVKKRGRSSTLSHLFAQGVTSAELLLGDDDFRKAASDKVIGLDPNFSDAIPSERGARDKIHVSYVFLSRAKKRAGRPYGLPFFSMVSLKAAHEHLRGAGIDVTVKEIKEH